MSGPHTTISAWTRDEHEGWYTAELHGWKLKTLWQPNSKTERGRFSWVAEREGEPKERSHEHYEELAHAMAHAEAFAAHDAAVRTAALNAKKDEADTHD